VSNVNEQDLGELSRKCIATEYIIIHSRVNWMRGEEGTLLSNGLLDRNLIYNIFLCTILDAHKTETKLDFLIHDHLLSVGTSVHNINLGDNTNGTDTLGVKLTRHLQTIRCCHICIGRHHTKDDCAGVRHISVGHSTSNFFNIVWLISDGNTSDTRQINKSQIGTSMRVHLKNDRLVNDVLVCTTHLVGQVNDVVSNFLEVGELFALDLIREDGEGGCSFIHMVETEF
jgi:hypothetical protein